MGLFNFFGRADTSGSDLPEIFPFSVTAVAFIKSDLISTYSKILTDVIERTSKIPESAEPSLWDNCLQSENNYGLISLLACAMAEQSDLFLVWKKEVKVLRKATREEETQIKKDYEAAGQSSVGVYISFKKYRRTEMLNIYSAFEYCILASLNKSLNLSKAVQFKVSELRKSVSLIDSEEVKSQAVLVAKALGNGKDVLIDAKDIIETAMPDTSSSEKAILFLDAKKAFILSLPLSYISGEQTGGIGSTGEADTRAVERGLKQYFVSIIRPAMKALFGVDVEFKTQDFRAMTSALEILKVFQLVDNSLISEASKSELIARMFDLDWKKEQKLIAKEGKEVEKENGQTAPVQEGDERDNAPEPSRASRFA